MLYNLNIVMIEKKNIYDIDIESIDLYINPLIFDMN